MKSGTNNQIRKLLSVFLTLCLLIGFVPVGMVWADDPDPVSVTDEAGLRSAIGSATAGDIIKIDGAINLTSNLDIGQSVTLTSDTATALNAGNFKVTIPSGKNVSVSGALALSGSAASVVEVAGSFTLNGNASVTQTGTGSNNRAIYITGNGAVTIAEGEVNSTHTGIRVENGSAGTVTVTNGTITGTTNAIDNYGTVNVSGGTIGGESNTEYGIYIRGGGSAAISGGSIKGSSYAVYAIGTADISGGAFTGSVISSNSGAINIDLSTGKIVSLSDGVKFYDTGQSRFFLTALPAVPVTANQGQQSTVSLTGAYNGVTFAVDGSTPAALGATTTGSGSTAAINMTPTAAGSYNLVLTAAGTGAATTQTLKLTLPVEVTGDTGDTPINITAIPGVTTPVLGATPVATITATDQYTGTVTWSPAHKPFDAGRAYTATITLTPKDGYTLTGVAANSFTVAGAPTATVTNSANSGVITAVFPATGSSGSFVCEISSGDPAKRYISLGNALTDVSNGQTITFIGSITHTYNAGIIVDNKTVTFNLNGRTLNVSNIGGTGLEVKNNGKLELFDDSGAFNITSAGYGVTVDGVNSSAAVTNISGVDTGARVSNGGQLTVSGNITASSLGVFATNPGSSVTVTGSSSGGAGGSGADATNGASVTVGSITSSGGANSYGARVGSGGTVTVNGPITGPENYVSVNGSTKMLGDGTTDPAKTGYLKYADGASTVWVKDTSASAGIALPTLSAGYQHALAIMESDGTLRAWGWNASGQLGTQQTGDIYSIASPVTPPGLSDIIAVAGGYAHSLALKNDGTVWAWGGNNYGQLGNNSTTSSYTPVQVSGLTGVTAIAAGEGHSLALKDNGTVWAWGYGHYGQLGDGNLGAGHQSLTPAQVQGLTGVKEISVSNYGNYCLALKADGTVWSWGLNQWGRLGDGTWADRSTPVQVSGLSGITGIAAGYGHALAVGSDGSVWAWGSNTDGQFGNGTTDGSYTPVEVAGLTGVQSVSGGNAHSLFLKTDGTVLASGGNSDGQLGNGTMTGSNTPVPVFGLTGVVDVSAGGSYSLALRDDGTIWGWGSNSSSKLGFGDINPRTIPVQIQTQLPKVLWPSYATPTPGPGIATGNPVWSYQSPQPTSSRILNMKVVNGAYWAAGENGTLLKSAEGIDWEKIDIGAYLYRLEGITYGNGTYMLVGRLDEYASVIYTSPNGTDWTEKAVIPHNLQDVAFGDDKFVAVGRPGKIMVSSDNGVNWQSITPTYPAKKSYYLQSITYAAGKFVAVGMGSDSTQDKGGIMTSVNGVDWSFPYTNANYYIEDVAYGNSTFVAVGGKDSGPSLICTSSDGTTWTEQTTAAAALTFSYFHSVEYAGGKFVAAGRTHPSTSSQGFAATSPNGTAWSGNTASGLPSFNTLASDGTSWVATGGMGSIYRSNNGQTGWDYITKGSTKTLNDVVWNGSDLYVAVGEAGTIQTSPNGQDWTIQISPTTQNLNKVDYLGGKFIAVGNNGTILTSLDGAAWTARNSGAAPDLRGIAYGGGKYVVVGGDGNWTRFIRTSDDGETWSTITPPGIAVSLNTVAFGDGVFITLTHSGAAFSSADGTTWAVAGSFSGYPSDLIYAGGKFAAVGVSGEVYFSTDKGAHWSSVKSAFDRINRSIAYGGGNFIVVGQLGNIIASADGGATWYRQSSGLKENPHSSENNMYTELRGITAGNNCFLAVGAAGLVLKSDMTAVSVNADAQDVAVAKAALSFGRIKHNADNSAGQITLGMNLITELTAPSYVPVGSGALDVDISWQSSRPAVISIAGAVNRPAFEQGDQVVSLTATFTKGSAVDTKTFIVRVPANEAGALTDAQRVAAAKAALRDGTVTVPAGADQAAKTAAVQSYVNGLLAAVPEAAGVTAIVTYNNVTGEYDVALSKGGASDSKGLDITVIESADPDIAIVTNALNAAANASYSNMTQRAASSENVIKAALRATAIAAVNNSGVNVTINGVGYIPPVAGTSANPGGTDGSYTFTVTVNKGAVSRTTSQKTITITATAYTTSGGGGGGDSSSNDIIITPEDQEARLNNNQTFDLQKDGLQMTIDPDDLPSLAENRDNIKVDIAAITDSNALNAFFIQYPGQQGVMKGYSVTLTQQGSSGQSETLTELNGEITLTFQLTPQELAGIDPSTLMVYKRAEDGMITEYSAEFDWSTNTLSISTSHLCEFFIMGEKGTPTQRLAGTDRYATAAAISAQGWQTSDHVILTSGADFPDALAGTVLAAVKDAPVLLTAKDSVSSATLAEIKRLKAKNIYLLGGTGVIAKGVEDQLAKEYTVTRIAGSNRYETAVRIAELVLNTAQSGTSVSEPAIDTAIITTGSDYPDALSVASLAGQRGLPILFTEKDALNALTAQALTTGAIRKVILVGGAGVISAQVEDTLRNEMNMEVTRLSGADRYLTGLEIAKHFVGSQDQPYKQIALTTGGNFPDALAGAALAAKLKMPVFLAGQQAVKAEIEAYLKGLDPDKIYLFGGQAVLADSVRDQLRP